VLICVVNVRLQPARVPRTPIPKEFCDRLSLGPPAERRTSLKAGHYIGEGQAGGRESMGSFVLGVACMSELKLRPPKEEERVGGNEFEEEPA